MYPVDVSPSNTASKSRIANLATAESRIDEFEKEVEVTEIKLESQLGPIKDLAVSSNGVIILNDKGEAYLASSNQLDKDIKICLQ